MKNEIMMQAPALSTPPPEPRAQLCCERAQELRNLPDELQLSDITLRLAQTAPLTQ